MQHSDFTVRPWIDLLYQNTMNVVVLCLKGMLQHSHLLENADRETLLQDRKRHRQTHPHHRAAQAFEILAELLQASEALTPLDERA